MHWIARTEELDGDIRDRDRKLCTQMMSMSIIQQRSSVRSCAGMGLSYRHTWARGYQNRGHKSMDEYETVRACVLVVLRTLRQVCKLWYISKNRSHNIPYPVALARSILSQFQ